MTDKIFNEMFAAALIGGGGGAAPTLITKNITANGSYAASDDDADGYSAVTVEVANTYTAGDEGKVVSNGALVTQTAYPSTITENGTYDTTLNNSVTVNVPEGAIIIPIIETTNYLKNLTAYLIIYNNKIILAGEYITNTRVSRDNITIIFNYDSNLSLNNFTQPYYAVLTGGFYSSASQAIRYNLTFDFSNKTITLSSGIGSSSIDDSTRGTISTYG